MDFFFLSVSLKKEKEIVVLDANNRRRGRETQGLFCVVNLLPFSLNCEHIETFAGRIAFGKACAIATR